MKTKIKNFIFSLFWDNYITTPRVVEKWTEKKEIEFKDKINNKIKYHRDIAFLYDENFDAKNIETFFWLKKEYVNDHEIEWQLKKLDIDQADYQLSFFVFKDKKIKRVYSLMIKKQRSRIVEKK